MAKFRKLDINKDTAVRSTLVRILIVQQYLVLIVRVLVLLYKYTCIYILYIYTLLYKDKYLNNIRIIFKIKNINLN